ncbi:MAG TPA: hypothetical protein VIT62_12540 [Lysobacter sp.]
MKKYLLLSVSASLFVSACADSRPQGEMVNPEMKRQIEDYDRQMRVVEAQAKRADDQLKRSDAQQARMDALLQRWESQADRYDAILSRWEKQGPGK